MALAGEFEQALGQEILCLVVVGGVGISRGVVFERFSSGLEIVVLEKYDLLRNSKENEDFKRFLHTISLFKMSE